jgi:GNAT superfamily N-acetyltransferase
MVDARAPDVEAGPADSRMAKYLDGDHHPQKALPARVAYVAMDGDTVVGYIGGHLTKRYGCAGELQYLYVVPGSRRLGVATELLRMLATWFTDRKASRVCVAADEENVAARRFLARHDAVNLTRAFLVWDDIGEVPSRGRDG